jgi:cyclopropane-fatty-acyl-phospholipid synthase
MDYAQKADVARSDYCEAGFKTRTLGDHIVTFTREGHVAFGCDVEMYD